VGKSDFLWKLFRKAVGLDSNKEKEDFTPPMRKLGAQGPRLKITTYISPELYRKCKHVAVELNTTVCSLIEEALAYYLEEKLKKEFPDIPE